MTVTLDDDDEAFDTNRHSREKIGADDSDNDSKDDSDDNRMASSG